TLHASRGDLLELSALAGSPPNPGCPVLAGFLVNEAWAHVPTLESARCVLTGGGGLHMRAWYGCTFLWSVLVVAGGGCGGREADHAALGSAPAASAAVKGREEAPSEALIPNRFGASRTINASGGPLQDPSNPFFQSLGTNGRSCSTCHVPEGGMTVTP